MLFALVLECFLFLIHTIKKGFQLIAKFFLGIVAGFLHVLLWLLGGDRK